MRQSSTEEEEQPARQRRPPNLCYNRNFRRLGDLSEEEQRSVVALICNKAKVFLFESHLKKIFQGPAVPAPAVGQTFTVTAHVCQVEARQVRQWIKTVLVVNWSERNESKRGRARKCLRS